MWQQLIQWLRPSEESLTQRMARVWPVDLHNHLVPGVDDGVKTLEQAMECLRQYATWGIRRVISTPHISEDYHPNTHTQLLKAAEAVQQAIIDEGLPLTFTVAAEYLLDDHFIKLLRANELLSFGANRYVLIETGWAAPPYQLEENLFTMQSKGYVPVLAHPERYRYYHDDIDKLLALQDKGCLFQMNLLSLTEYYGQTVQQMAQRLLKEKSIHFIGSDIHRSSDLKHLPDAFASNWYTQLLAQPLKMDTL
ncbi:MAG: histidinol-phosphatase [Cytophagales bacterium]|nr:MAG: histidinol-phosphatase [Cytophagales bacterium]